LIVDKNFVILISSKQEVYHDKVTQNRW